jgi:hypothetical protein
MHNERQNITERKRRERQRTVGSEKDDQFWKKGNDMQGMADIERLTQRSVCPQNGGPRGTAATNNDSTKAPPLISIQFLPQKHAPERRNRGGRQCSPHPLPKLCWLGLGSI